MILTETQILNICNDNLGEFKTKIEKIQYKKGGIFNSEMLLITSLIKYYNIKLIIESGRANGQSTKILVETFNTSDHKIYSVEYNRYSQDVKNSYERLKKHKNVKLLFGNSFNTVPTLITENCCVLIDGPKRFAAVKLAIKCLKNPLVKFVFIHDLYKDSPHRNAVEKIFLNHFFTDNKEFVKRFRSIDLDCWLTIQKFKETKSWAPYKRGNRIFKSYGPTLMVIFNSNNLVNIQEFTSHEIEIKGWEPKWKIRYLLEGWPNRLKNWLKFPKYYIYYEKIVINKKNISLIYLSLKWGKLVFNNLRSLFKKRINFYSEESNP